MKIGDVNSLDIYLENCSNVGFQGTNLGKARDILKKILKIKRETPKEITFYLGFTANLVASGMRGYFTKLVKEKLVDVIVTTGGAIEHDVIKSFLDYEIGSFNVDDKKLHEEGINRIGNIFVRNKCYEFMEKVSYSVFEELSGNGNNLISPSELTNQYGKYVNDNSIKKEESFLFQCYKNNVPVFCPGIIDAAIGLHSYFFKQKHSEFGIDVTKDMKRLADLTLNTKKTGALILGGGISKHHIIGANIVRGGLDFAIYVTTAVEYDGSLSGARHYEGISWGKIKSEEKSVTIYGDVSLVLPLLVENIV